MGDDRLKVWSFSISYPRDLKAPETFTETVKIIEDLLISFKTLAKLEKNGKIKAGVCWDTGWGWDIEVLDESVETMLKELSMVSAIEEDLQEL